ncbi:alpha/beta hydrolase [Gordonia jinhuaensis]|uniref:Alpha/beta hydrolase n=1 Tax=Gordonia jinhuaensis TaxID=1517702 RepID=A0A916TF03_9ACTN|nr:alpha/beta hydrolase [Gordonia jinhuaensis]GGB42440.1 alpha/beta hydrolase [Gordonia jinhuaensis]
MSEAVQDIPVESIPTPTVVLLHGAWAGSWVWDLLTPALEAAGLTVVRPDLPGGGDRGASSRITLSDMVDHVLEEITHVNGPLVVIGHSGGGVVATSVAERLCHEPDPRIRGLGFVAGMMMPSGMNFGVLCDTAELVAPVGISAFTAPTADGLGTEVSPEAAASVFFHNAAPDLAIPASRRMVSQQESARLIAPEWTEAGAGSLPRLYVEATEDRSVPLAAQRTMQQLWPGARVVTLESDHAPQLSRADDLASIVIEWVLNHVSLTYTQAEPASAGATLEA